MALSTDLTTSKSINAYVRSKYGTYNIGVSFVTDDVTGEHTVSAFPVDTSGVQIGTDPIATKTFENTDLNAEAYAYYLDLIAQLQEGDIIRRPL